MPGAQATAADTAASARSLIPTLTPPGRRGRPRPPEPEIDAGGGPEPSAADEADFRTFDTEDTGGPAVGYFAETLDAFARGPFRERELAEGSESDFYSGELPTAGFADADAEEADAFANASGLFFGAPAPADADGDSDDGAGFGLGFNLFGGGRDDT
ncbi:MAG: hypothetical protein ACOCSD_07465 [Halolamina sp.]